MFLATSVRLLKKDIFTNRFDNKNLDIVLNLSTVQHQWLESFIQYVGDILG
jgi:hypothetical protein